MQRLQRADELAGCAIRHGDDVALGIAVDNWRSGRLTSGTISGTCGSLRKAREVSITMQPAAENGVAVLAGGLVARGHEEAELDGREIEFVDVARLQRGVTEADFPSPSSCARQAR